MRVSLCVALLLTGAGCSGSDGMGTVTGTVTLDGQPLPNAIVFFQPGHGRPSSAITDSAGVYFLMYTAKTEGALVGKHVVHIRTEMDAMDERPAGREFLPERYHEKSELNADVQPGANRVDFALTSS
jgi:hypothetical protein